MGTRPEAIKLAPVLWEIDRHVGNLKTRLVVTGQHEFLLKQALVELGMIPDVDFGLMEPNQSLSRLASRIVDAVGEDLTHHPSSAVIVQGDTVSACAAALAAFLLRVPVAHVEAGLRSYDLDEPFPEEGSRQIISRLASLHFAPTRRAATALRRENVPRSSVHVTGNTVVDALREISRRVGPVQRGSRSVRTILLTIHRRENFGARLARIFQAITDLTQRRDDLEIIYPVHPNPHVSGPARNWFAENSHVNLVEPMTYTDLVRVLKRAHLVLTDSGGLQEEAPVFGKPVLVLRERTERPEALEAGTAILVGTQTSAIVSATERLLDDDDAYRSMARSVSPFGDGRAAKRIVRVLGRFLEAINERPKISKKTRAPSNMETHRSHDRRSILDAVP
jgi:UDP-N-acetylglucosamine 2-epimerase (non-hydrolysing)